MPKITNQEEFEDFFFGLDTNPTMENGFTSRNDLSKIENKIEAMGLGVKGQDEKGKDIVIGPGATEIIAGTVPEFGERARRPLSWLSASPAICDRRCFLSVKSLNILKLWYNMRRMCNLLHARVYTGQQNRISKQKRDRKGRR